MLPQTSKTVERREAILKSWEVTLLEKMCLKKFVSPSIPNRTQSVQKYKEQSQPSNLIIEYTQCRKKPGKSTTPAVLNKIYNSKFYNPQSET